MNDALKSDFLVVYESSRTLKQTLVDLYSVSTACEVPDVFMAEWAMRNIDSLSQTIGESERILPAVDRTRPGNSPQKGARFPQALSRSETQQIQSRLFGEIRDNVRLLQDALNRIATKNFGPGFDVFIADWAKTHESFVAPIARGCDRLYHHLTAAVQSQGLSEDFEEESPEVGGPGH